MKKYFLTEKDQIETSEGFAEFLTKDQLALLIGGTVPPVDPHYRDSFYAQSSYGRYGRAL